MSNQMILYIMGGSAVTLVIIVLIYFILSKKMQGSEYRKIQKLQQGTKQKSFSTEVLFQKLYLTYIKIPFIKRYALKIRRRLEIINIDDEYNTRKGTAKILTRTLAIVVPVMILTIMISSKNFLLMFILLLFELFMIDTLIDGSVDKIDNKILKEQIDFFSEIRHAYHEYNMVEEAIYQVSQDDEKDVSRQGEKIYEILISDDPEMELEKYYDIAPNSFLKEFAGVSYLTKEFGDRKVDGASLYLKNVNNITQEMQLEILKRDKLNYVFQSLSVIAIAPVLLLEPLKNWAISNFSFTASWYQGKAGMIVQMLILLITFVSYVLVRKLKDNGSTAIDTRTENPWQEKLYKKKPIKKIVDLFIPKKGTKEYRKVVQLLKDAASPQKMEWLFMNRIAIAIVTFCASIIIFTQLHVVAINYIYTEPTTDYNIIGGLSEKDEKKAMEITKQDNIILDQYRGKPKTTQEQIKTSVQKLKYYEGAESTEIDKAAERIYNKLHVINTEYVQWFELLLAFVFAVIGYMAPLWILVFQAKMRQLEMEDEVMQFQTIILMLMRIERVNVEIILEWLERYSNIFKAPITKCVNNYEAGAWESLEAMKEEVNYVPMIRIIESLQAAVEKIPITDAFDELDSERDYYQEKRKESNERLIKRKGMIGKAIGFAPMVCLFVGYLIIPLVFIGLTSMSSSFSSMTATTTK
ncbi:MAG: hypothetical protein UFI45_00165 [Clostridia bacterium]|nr:hypothetical protein [Clostridia bacterium]MED9923708.1 hypothetical protein [Clostridia bacterium]CDC07015.1 putative uncharacterized protein [Clostridium sp. CAG:343]HCF34486.1 hypothetical protein [Clostridiales bacterium]